MTEIIITNSKGENERRFTRVMSARLFDSLNGECTFEFTVMCSTLSAVDVGEKVELRGDEFNYLFNIVKVSKKMSGGIAVVTVECEHKSYELNNPEYTVTKFEFKGAPIDCLTELLNGTNLTAGICDFTVPVELKINQECTRRAAVMQLIALCGGEIEYDGLSINIRRHRGSESYIELMDGKNVTDLSTEKDSRGSTDSYDLTLYKNTDLQTGDNVDITFRPFGLSARTRIISMSFNPYNRFEIQIEVGDYRPSINDSLYKLEKENSKTNQSVAEATAAINSDTNNSQINISDTDQRVIKLSYNAYKNTYSAFCVTVKFEITTAGNVIFFIRLGPNERIRYTENFDVGKHTKTFNYPFVSEDSLNTITFHVLTDNGAEGFLPAVQTWGYVIGAAIAGDSPWDGYDQLLNTVKEAYGNLQKSGLDEMKLDKKDPPEYSVSKIRTLLFEPSKESETVKAVGSVEINDSIIISGVTVKHGTNKEGVEKDFVSMPSYKFQNEMGKDVYIEYAHAITADFRERVENSVLNAYQVLQNTEHRGVKFSELGEKAKSRLRI